MKKFLSFLTVLAGGACLFAEEAEGASSFSGSGIKYLAAAIAVGLACIAS